MTSVPPSSQSAPPRFLKIEEAAYRLRVSRDLLYDLARRRELPGCTKIGRLYRVDWEELVKAWTHAANEGGHP